MLKKSSRFAASSVVIALCFVLQLFSCNTKKVLMISRWRKAGLIALPGYTNHQLIV